MAYSKKPKKNPKEAADLQLAKNQWDAYTRARDNGHEEYHCRDPLSGSSKWPRGGLGVEVR